MTLVVKSLVPLVAGGGLGAGGVYVYKDVIPKTWKEHLEREGYRLIGSTEGSTIDNDYKAIFVDSEDIRKEIDSLKNHNDISTAYSKIKDYCEEELNKKTNESTANANQMIRLCTYSGISTVKARLVRSGKSDWTKEDDHWKVAFALNKYHSQFLTWINNGETSTITRNDQPSSKFNKLKEKCETEWKKKYSEYGDDKAQYNDIYWWCRKPEKTTVQDRLKTVVDGWTQETNGDTIKNSWQHTSLFTDQMKKDLGRHEASVSDLEASSYKNWCDNQLKKSLGDDDIYQNNYLMVKSVCKKSTSKGK